MRLKDKVAIVTGGASGIGEASVIDMVNEGAKVVIADINDELGQALVARLGEDTVYVHADVSREDDIKNMVDVALKRFGRLDILFNNAGIGHMAVTEELDLEGWQKTIDINLTGVFLCCKYAVPHLKRSGGSIVNNASILGTVGQAQTAAYSAAKGGVVNITKSLALEYAEEGIRVNSVSPGYIETPLLAQLDEPTKQYLTSLHPLGRMGRSEEVAKAVTFLACDDASFITGANLLVDGGYTAR